MNNVFIAPAKKPELVGLNLVDHDVDHDAIYEHVRELKSRAQLDKVTCVGLHRIDYTQADWDYIEDWMFDRLTNYYDTSLLLSGRMHYDRIVE